VFFAFFRGNNFAENEEFFEIALQRRQGARKILPAPVQATKR
jgi:hypothetical protein